MKLDTEHNTKDTIYLQNVFTEKASGKIYKRMQKVISFSIFDFSSPTPLYSHQGRGSAWAIPRFASPVALFLLLAVLQLQPCWKLKRYKKYEIASIVGKII